MDRCDIRESTRGREDHIRTVVLASAEAMSLAVSAEVTLAGRSRRRSRQPHGRHGPHRGRPWVPWPPSPPAPHPLFWLQRRLWVLVEPTLSPVGLPILLNVSVTLPARLGQGGPLDHIAIYSRRTQRNAGRRARYTRHKTKLTIVGVNRAMPADQAVLFAYRERRTRSPPLPTRLPAGRLPCYQVAKVFGS